MPTLSPSHIRKVCTRYFLCCFAGLALAASAQSQAPGQNLNTNALVVIPPDAPVQQQPTGNFQPQQSSDTQDSFWRIQKVSEDDDWTRHFRIGAMVGMNISANFSAKGTFNINRPPGVYDDGYVRTDDTGNAGGQTGYWGYNSPSQLSGSTLTMHNTTSYSANGNSETGDSVFPGIDMAYGGNLWNWGRTRIGWDLGFGLLPISITDNRSMSATANQSTYTFNTGPIVVPGAPYQGGPSSVPTISTNFTVSNGTNNGTITGSHTLEVMLYTVRLGPSLYWDLNQHLGLSAGVGPALGIVSGDYKYDEIVSAGGGSARNHGQVGGTDLVYGGYVNATLMYHLVENGDLYVGVQYMSLGNATISGGGRQGRLNLGGQVYISAGINWPF